MILQQQKIECFLHGSNDCMMEKNVKAYTYLFLTPKLIQFEICKLARAVVMVMEIALLVQQSYKLMGFCERKLF